MKSFVGGLLGARILYLILENPQPNFAAFLWQLPRIWDGGIILYGSIAGGVLGYVAYYWFSFRRFGIPTLQLAEVYTREFPNWLWDHLTTANGAPARADSRSLSPSVLLSLGQFVERPDLANGPRTVVDVFCRAISRFQDTSSCYDVGDLVTDLHGGVFRYFGEGAPVQRTLTELLKDAAGVGIPPDVSRRGKRVPDPGGPAVMPELAAAAKLVE